MVDGGQSNKKEPRWKVGLLVLGGVAAVCGILTYLGIGPPHVFSSGPENPTSASPPASRSISPSVSTPALPASPQEHEVALGLNTYWLLDEFPLKPAASFGGGFAVTQYPGSAGESLVADGGIVVPAPGTGMPSEPDCIDATGAGGSNHLALGGTQGEPQAAWLCAKTMAGHVLRLRYDGGTDYRFLIIWSSS